jgi:cAMP-binding proteins - catabolite gene activator and regulatory subunit of cAMP-dependent protein kinases
MKAGDGASILVSDIFQDLAPTELAAIRRVSSLAHYESGHIFFSPEERDDYLHILQNGRVRLYKLSAEGRALTLAVLEPVAVFGEMSVLGPWRHDSFAEASDGLRRWPLSVTTTCFRLWSSIRTIALRLMDLMAQRLQSMENKLADIAFKSVPQRLATVLLDLVADSGLPQNGTPTVVRYTHQQLAEMIGSYRETVTKAVGDFRDGGLIRIEEEAIYLTDVPRLQSLAKR